jgi:hypothetical protein
MAKRKLKTGLTKDEATIIENLTKELVANYTPEQISIFLCEALKSYANKYDFADAIMKDDTIADILKEKSEDENKNAGFIVLQINGLEKRSKLENFLSSEIYPFYNEQRDNLSTLFN